ncbi:DUF148 domain-containing protein [Caenorhabditis elegans]|uniref:DUF148 domain-containing protein n=1 Tax=Caenorhabditis elegans TaxID=6239 RepID=A7LPH6_CAEEL|nr:DUF148 domain-containing protein [Caenorhabditis elegans]CAO82070.1 DUF148 domain-containing protein [Caenorhabditis elegans]|eukprot:NP_001122988.1 Uncharacterized protein CELE_R11D1.13 [Caenorhabditis elegans]
MKFLILSFLLVSICSGGGGFPIQMLTKCGISKETIDGVQSVIDEHSAMIKIANSNKRAKKTEIDSLKADIDLYLDEHASDDDKKRWIECFTKNNS